MSRESTIQQNILDYLNGLPGCIAENVQGNAFTGSGRPDINACYHGRMIRIEVKTADNDNTVSQSQDLNLRKWAHRGALCIVAYTLDDVMEALHYCILNDNGTCVGCRLAKTKLCYTSKYRDV